VVEQLSVPDEELLSWSENEDLPVNAQTKLVGASLNIGKSLHKDLQNQYFNQSDLNSASYDDIIFRSP